ncbi:MAG: putative 4-hydroxybenzoate polyprenyltransferase [Alistipes sp.]|nr:putative 4-hydroxybenzoate polyprenyltransferase [Alistipes sp.]
MFQEIAKYLRLVKFSHTIFAMPFALMSFAYALWSSEAEFSWWLLLQVVLCMVFARNVAMGFNRWADHKIDAENPRTASREIPAGQISPRKAMIFVVINAVLFIATASTINLLTATLSPVALAVIMFYSYCKRFTSLAHLVLGLSLAIAPAGAYIAVTGTLTFAPCLLSLVVLTWTGGFDIIYALQDVEFDRKRGLHSIPSHFSVATSLYISIALHCVSVVALVLFAWHYLPQGWLLWCGVGLFTAILIAEHLLVTPTKQRSIGIAFGTLNGLASMTLATFVIANILIFG